MFYLGITLAKFETFKLFFFEKFKMNRKVKLYKVFDFYSIFIFFCVFEMYEFVFSNVFIVIIKKDRFSYKTHTYNFIILLYL